MAAYVCSDLPHLAQWDERLGEVSDWLGERLEARGCGMVQSTEGKLKSHWKHPFVCEVSTALVAVHVSDAAGLKQCET